MILLFVKLFVKLKDNRISFFFFVLYSAWIIFIKLFPFNTRRILFTNNWIQSLLNTNNQFNTLVPIVFNWMTEFLFLFILVKEIFRSIGAQPSNYSKYNEVSIYSPSLGKLFPNKYESLESTFWIIIFLPYPHNILLGVGLKLLSIGCYKMWVNYVL